MLIVLEKGIDDFSKAMLPYARTRVTGGLFDCVVYLPKVNSSPKTPSIIFLLLYY